MRRAVFLDRDGVINRCEVRNGKPYAPRDAAEFRLLPGARAAIQALKNAHFLVIVVTNQPDVGNRTLDPAVLEAMHDKLRRRLAVDEIKVCPHSQDAGCKCRKPQPGMLIEAASRWKVNLARSFMIGDRSSDIVAGQAVGCYSILIDRGYSEPRSAVPDSYTKSLSGATRLILSRCSLWRVSR